MNPASRSRLSSALLVAVTALGHSPAQNPVSVDQARRTLDLRAARFDPVLDGVPELPADLRGSPDQELYLLQLHGSPTDAVRADLATRGVFLHAVVPTDGFVARVDPSRLDAVRALAAVRWLGPLPPAWRLPDELLVPARTTTAAPVRSRMCDLVMVAPKAERRLVLQQIEAVGGTPRPDAGAGLLQVAELTPRQALQLARLDTVLWIEPTPGFGRDIDNARIQGGADALEVRTGIRGEGIVGMVLEGVHATHVEFAAAPPFRSTPIAVPGTGVSPNPSNHGTWTAGEMFSRGARPDARGLLPHAQMLYCNFGHFIGTNGRRAVTAQGIAQHRQMFETASWGYSRTRFYTARSAELDEILFDLDMPTTQSFAEGPPGEARPESWAKNVITVGGVCHGDNADPRDDRYCNQATGPAPDGRIKPELVGYYDNILTTDGPTNGYRPDMGGTSGATPIVAGYLGLTIELFARGAFGHPAAPTWQQLFDYRPHFTTAKALLVNSARQYAFSGTNHNLTRMHQGWGFPAVQDLLEASPGMLVIDETRLLTQGGSRDQLVFVRPGTTRLGATLTWADPPANPATTTHRVNSLDLRLTAPDGTIYHGNQGMAGSMFTLPGGSPNDVDTLENVYVQAPAAGLWTVRVAAPAIRLDGHVQTAATDADYALAVSGLGGVRDRSGPTLDLASNAPGQLRVTAGNLPGAWARGYTVFSATVDDPSVGAGNLLGVELDGLALATLSQPPGSLFHFTSTGGGTGYPASPFDFPPQVARLLQGRTFDAVLLLFDAGGQLLDVSNTTRVTVQ